VAIISLLPVEATFLGELSFIFRQESCSTKNEKFLKKKIIPSKTIEMLFACSESLYL
jgi:hypothetical protein